MRGEESGPARVRRGPHAARPGSSVLAGVPESVSGRRRAAGRGGRGNAANRGRPGGQARLAEVAQGSALNLLGAGVSAATTVGVTVLVTRHFSRLQAGTFFTATSAFIIVEAVASLGANVGLVYFIAGLRSLGRERRIPVILRAAVIPVIVASLLGTALMLGVAVPLAHVLLSGHVGRGGVRPGAVADSLRILGLALPFAALIDTFLGASRGYRDMRPTVLVDRIGRSTAQMIGVAVAAAAGTEALLAPLWALPYVPAVAAAWLWLRHTQRHAKPLHPDLPDVPPELAALLALSTLVPQGGSAAANGTSRSVRNRHGRPAGERRARRSLADATPRGFWRFTTPRAVASLTSVILQRIDIVLVAIIRGPTDAAIYTVATRFLVVGQFGNMAISMSAQPRFTELFAAGDKRNANVIYRVTTAWLVLLTWPLYLLAIIYGPQLLAVFGHSYSAGDDVMIILGVAMLFSTACGQVDMVLITTGRSSWSLANGLLGMTVNVGMDLALIPRYGITGAAIGWAVAIVVVNVMPLIQLMITMKLSPFGRGTLAACALSTVSFGVVPLAMRAVLGGSSALVAGLAAGCVLQVAGLWWFRRPLRLAAMPGMSFLRSRRARG